MRKRKIFQFFCFIKFYFTYIYVNAKNVLLIKTHGQMQSELWTERNTDRDISTHLRWDETRGNIF